MLYLGVQVSASSLSNTRVPPGFFLFHKTNTTTQHGVINFSPGTRATAPGPHLRPDSGRNATKIKVPGFQD
ncbi:hypothetical protein Hanom_Chr08g00683971 [Helianthus anomalus]